MLSRIRVTCTPEIPKATVAVKHSFVNSSTQVRHLILRQVASASMTKFIDQVHHRAEQRQTFCCQPSRFWPVVSTFAQ